MSNTNAVAGNGILAGIRVLDFGRYVAGPYCATLLGYLGAEVIRIEKTAGGEDRYIAPFPGTDAGAVLLQTACNKRSLALDFGSPEADDIRDLLLASADMVVANLPAPALRKLGLDYDRLRKINPRLILLSQSSFGNEGPLASQGGFDGVAQAMSGAMFMTGQPGQPVKAAAPYVDFSTAVLSAFGALAALLERQQSGLGQEVRSSLLGTALSVFGSHLAEQGTLGLDREPSGNRVQTSAPSDVFRTRDGHILTHVVGMGLFRRCATLLGQPELSAEPDLATDQQRGDARDRLCALMADWCRERDSEQALTELAAAGIPAGPVLDLQQAIDHPQVQAMEFLRQAHYPGAANATPVCDLPLHFDRPQPGIQQPPPGRGQHSREILRELGLDEGAIDQLAQRGVIYCA